MRSEEPNDAGGPCPSPGRRVREGLRQVLCGAALVLAAVYLVRAFDSLSLRPLQPWHRLRPAAEFRAGDDDDWKAYLEREQRLFEEVAAALGSAPGARSVTAATDPLSRYLPGGVNDPGRDPFGLGADWNRSYELAPTGGDRDPARPRGAALLVHGLSDSPYSLRACAEQLAALGYHVVGLRLPGHGTVPGALAGIDWRDWAAAVELAARRAHERAAGGPLVLVGYSAGGALVTRYAARVAGGAELPPPTQLVLLSPAIGITPLARVGTWHRYLSWTPWFERFAWQAVEPEYDPYKYNSFPKRASAEMRGLALDTCAQLARLERDGAAGAMPPTLAFQSLVDATVSTRAVLLELFARLESPGTELVLFDVNRHAALTPFLAVPERDTFERLRDDPRRRFRLTLVGNRGDSTDAVQAVSWPAGSLQAETESLGVAWPREVYSLSHVAMPFAPEDPHYGLGLRPDGEPAGASDGPGRPAWNLGTVAPRGERGLLAVALEDLMRLRHNPFHAFVRERIRASVEE